MAYAYIEQPWSGRRLVGLFGAIGVNVLFISAIATGLNFEVIKDEPVIDLVPVAEPAPPPKPDDIVRIPDVVDPKPEVFYAPPEFDDVTPPPGEGPESTPTIDPSPPQPLAPAIATQLQADPRYPLVQPIYPPISIRRDEQGVVTLLIYVLTDGRVGDVRVKKSSGFARLDEAAVKTARRDWRFQPATQGGTAVAAWGQYAVVFEINDQE